jgi:hypothetical protein
MFDIDPSDVKYAIGPKSYVETPCRCSLSSTGGGFCQDIFGTLEYKNYIQQMKYLY